MAKYEHSWTLNVNIEIPQGLWKTQQKIQAICQEDKIISTLKNSTLLMKDGNNKIQEWMIQKWSYYRSREKEAAIKNRVI